MHLKIHNNFEWLILASILVIFGYISFFWVTESGVLLHPFSTTLTLLFTCFFYSYFFVGRISNHMLLLVILFTPIHIITLQFSPEAIAVMIVISYIYDNLLNIQLHKDVHYIIKLGFLFVVLLVLTENMFLFIGAISIYLFFGLKEVFDRKYFLNILIVYYFPLMLFLLSVYYIRAEFHQFNLSPLLSESMIKDYRFSKLTWLFFDSFSFYDVMVCSVVIWIISSIFVLKKISLKREVKLLIVFSFSMTIYYIASNPEKWFWHFSILLYSLPLCIYKHNILTYRKAE